MMNSLLAIDPGINTSGVALFKDGTLIEADIIKCVSKDDIACRSLAMSGAIVMWLHRLVVLPDWLVMEWPQIYPKMKGDPNDLPHLAAIGLGVAGMLTVLNSKYESHLKIASYKPREWKGQIPKGSVYDSRIANKLEGDELEIWRETKDHNAKDAIGLGLKALGRF